MPAILFASVISRVDYLRIIAATDSLAVQKENEGSYSMRGKVYGEPVPRKAQVYRPAWTAELNRSILKEDLWLAISLLPICGCNNIHAALLCIFLSCGISSDIRADMFCSFQFADAFSCGIFHSNICATAYFS